MCVLNPPYSPNNPQFNPMKQVCPDPNVYPIHPYGIAQEIPRATPNAWPTSGNPNPTNPAPNPNPYGSVKTFPNSPGYRG